MGQKATPKSGPRPRSCTRSCVQTFGCGSDAGEEHSAGCQLSPLAGFRPKCLRVSALQPFGRVAGVGAPPPGCPLQGHPCQLSPLAGFGPQYLGTPALQPFGKEAGGGAPTPDTPYRGTRSVDQRPEDRGQLAVIGPTRLIGRVENLTRKMCRNRPEHGSEMTQENGLKSTRKW